MNLHYVCSLQGTAKSASMLLGLISVCFMGFAYDRSVYNNLYKIFQQANSDYYTVSLQREVYFLSSSIVFLLVSVGFFLCHLLNERLQKCQQILLMDIAFHALGAVLLMSGACLAGYSAREIEKKALPFSLINPKAEFAKDTMQYKNTKIAAAVFGALNGIVYGFISLITTFYYCRRPNTQTNSTINNT